MDNRTHLIMLGSYIGLGFLAMLIMPLMGGGLVGMLIGLMIMAGGGLLHEFLSRREGFKKVGRAVVALRKIVDKTAGDMDGIQKELGKAAADARSATQAAIEVKQTAKAAAEQLESMKGGGGDADLAPRIEQIQQAQELAAADMQQVQDAGNQLHAELQALQQKQAMAEQQIQHLQTMLQQMQQMPQMPVAADLPPPVPQPPAAPPPRPAPPAATPAPAPDFASDEPAAAAPAPARAPASAAAPAGDFTAAALQTMEAAVAAACTSDNLVDNSLRAIAISLNNDAVDLYVEPIVTLPERKLAHYECYGGVRADDGSPLTIDQHLDMSGRERAMAAIENALMARCLDRIDTVGLSGDGAGCFYNVAGPTLGDRSFYSRLVAHLGANPQLAGKLVLEFSQAVLMEHGEQAVEDLVRSQEAGCRFSIDEITDLEIDFESLLGFGFRFVKVGSKFIRVQANTADDPDTVRGLATSLRALGLETVVENVETDLSLVELIGFEIGLGQGPLFGQPAIHKPR